jgi:hypothetical protein
MDTLPNNWFAEGNIDFELKKYTLLAYLMDVNHHFHHNELYPQLSDLIYHYNKLVAFKKNKDSLQHHFPQRLSSADFEELKLNYEKLILDDALIQEIESIIQYSILKMDESIKEGQEIYDFVDDNFTISPVGLMPIGLDQGYFLLADGNEQEVKVFGYQMSFYEDHLDKYRGIRTQYISSYPRNFINTYPNIKIDLLKKKDGPTNPAVYSLETPLTFPLQETLLPIARRSLVRFIAENSGNPS